MSIPRSRIHLILPELSEAQACALLDVCGDLIDALWNTHGDTLVEFCARRAEHQDLDRREERAQTITENDGDEIDF